MFKQAWKALACGIMAALLLASGFGMAQADELRLGQLVRFGEWYGDALNWYVINIQGSRVMLMLAEDQLDHRAYNSEQKPVTWESCTLRQWLNGEFYNQAFTAKEKKRIQEVTVPAHKNPQYATDPGRDTEDSVFLLSIPEYEQLLKVQKLRVFTRQGKGQFWWLRSPGPLPGSAARVGKDGSLDLDDGTYVYYGRAVRPVLWINL